MLRRNMYQVQEYITTALGTFFCVPDVKPLKKITHLTWDQILSHCASQLRYGNKTPISYESLNAWFIIMKHCSQLLIVLDFPYSLGNLHVFSIKIAEWITLYITNVMVKAPTWSRDTDYGRPEETAFTARPKIQSQSQILGTAEAYFVCHIGPIF